MIDPEACQAAEASQPPTPVQSPEACQTMAQVRAGVDATDRKLSRLIARRFAYMDAAARIKSDRSHVRDEARKADVVRNAATNAVADGWPPLVATALWDQLVEASIAYEFDAFDRITTSVVD